MLKGHAKIELTNVKTGEVQSYEEDNLVTNAMKYYFEHLVNDNPNGAIQHTRTVQQMYGGILCYEQPLEENPDNIFPPIDEENLLVAHAGQSVNTGSDLTRGSYNATEQSFIPYQPQENGKKRGEYKFVWDFTTAQGNGTISSLALTSPEFGDSGLDKKSIIYPKTGDKKTWEYLDNSYCRYVRRLSYLNMFGCYFNQELLNNGYCYSVYVDINNLNHIYIKEIPFEYKKIHLMNYYGTTETIDKYKTILDIDLGEEPILYRGNNYRQDSLVYNTNRQETDLRPFNNNKNISTRCCVIENFDEYSPYMYVGYVTSTVKTSNYYYINIIKINTNTLEYNIIRLNGLSENGDEYGPFTLRTLLTGYTLYSGNVLKMFIKQNCLIVKKSYDNSSMGAFNLDNFELNGSTMPFISRDDIDCLYGNFISTINNGIKYKINNNGTISLINNFSNSNSASYHRVTFPIITDNKTKTNINLHSLYFKSAIDLYDGELETYYLQANHEYPLVYLGTINNLETPITKTSDQTMKITYTLIEEEE